jgi:HAD superfamily hydrolase (TIGR01484 family)
MKPFVQIPEEVRKNIRYVLTDIDDTLTLEGRLPAAIFTALEALRAAGFIVVPITGRPAGWCDHIARMWPVDGIVGENGAFYFVYDDSRKKMIRRYWKPENERRSDRERLKRLEQKILAEVPGCGVSADQAYREADLAIDFCEDVTPLSITDVAKIESLFQEAGAQAKISSIHVNGWFGNYDKLTMTRCLFEEVFGKPLGDIREQVIYTGDSPNDQPMFAYFPHAVGVANVMHFQDQMTDLPAWITSQPGGFGFAEMVTQLLS